MWFVLVTQLCSTLCDPTDYRPSGSSVHGIFQARILEWVAIPFSRGSSWPWVSGIAGKLFTLWTTREARVVYGSSTVCAVNSLQLCPTLCNSLDCSPPDSSVFGDSPARTLECVAMLSSRGSSEPRDQTLISCVPPRKQCNLCWTFAFLLRVWNFGNMLSRECWNDQSSVKNFDAKSKWASLGKNIVHVTALFWFLKLNYNGI